MGTYRSKTTPEHEAFDPVDLSRGKIKTSPTTGSSPGDRQRLAFNKTIKGVNSIDAPRARTLNEPHASPESGPQIKPRRIPREKVIS